MKKFLLVFLVLAILFSVGSCSFIDELKGLSMYSDFLFAFQKKWNDENASGAWLEASNESATIYKVNLDGLAGKVGTYSGTVEVCYVRGKSLIGSKEKTYFRVKAALSVEGKGKTPISNTTAMELQASCLDDGFIVDGYVLLRNNDPSTLVDYTQTANLEGLRLSLKKPETPSPSEPEPTP